MQTKTFNFATVLSIIHGRTLSNEVLPIIEFMTRKRFPTDQIAAGMNLCRPKLIEMFPLLNNPQTQTALIKLDADIDSKDEGSCADQIIVIWLRQQEASCPYKTFNVPRIENQISPFEKFLAQKRTLEL